MVETKAAELSERPCNTLGLGNSIVKESHGRAERKHHLRPEQRARSTSSTEGAMIGATSSKNAVKKLKEREIELPDRNFVDLTADSPQNSATRLADLTDMASPELSFLRSHHRTGHRPNTAFVPKRSYIQVPAEADIMEVAPQITESKKSCSGLRSPRETRNGVPFSRMRADRQRAAAGMLEDATTSSGASSGRTNARPAPPLDAKERNGKASVSSGMDYQVYGCSSDLERLPVWKRKRPSITDACAGRQSFKPPRKVSERSTSGSSLGVLQRPIEVDSLEYPSSSATAENNVAASPNRDRQIKEDELLAKFLQEDDGLEADGGNCVLDDAQLARMLQEEENAKCMQQRVGSSSQAVNASTLRAASREMQRVLPTISSPATRPTVSSSRMRILRNLHNRSRQHVMRGRRLGGSSTMNAGEHLLHFPEGLDLESRVEFLAAMETVSQGSFAMLGQVDRDFNEGDYEMLLALDDTNHTHSGASYSKIEQLPISVIKPTDVYEETCSICLEIPVVDDVVRRLPCMHGFHLQCIDEWLGRQANCPICKMDL